MDEPAAGFAYANGRIGTPQIRPPAIAPRTGLLDGRPREPGPAMSTQESQLRSRTDRSQPAMSWSVSATWSGAENIAQ